MQCPICLSRKYRVVAQGRLGYVEGTSFDIFACDKCHSQYITHFAPPCHSRVGSPVRRSDIGNLYNNSRSPTSNSIRVEDDIVTSAKCAYITDDVDSGIYDKIYASSDKAGYDRYYQYAIKIKHQPNPLKYLADQEVAYYSVYQTIINRHRLDILDAGCGYGYLTYAIKKAGHSVIGIDVSKKAIAFARKHFGDFYIAGDIGNYQSHMKFDLIVASELVEHLSRPIRVIAACANMLKKGGKIVITTPNKDFFNNSAVWKTDLPPVHTVWLGKKSVKEMAKRLGFDCRFISFSRYAGKAENRLLDFVSSRLGSRPMPALNTSGRTNARRAAADNSMIKKIVRAVCYFTPTRWLSNAIGRLLIREHPTLGVVLTKRTYPAR